MYYDYRFLLILNITMNLKEFSVKLIQNPAGLAAANHGFACP